MRLLLLFLMLVVLLSTGCLYTDVTTVLDTDLHETQLGTKVGESSSTSILWLVAWGDAGTQAAANDAGITTILHADRRIVSVLFGTFLQVTTIVYGN